MENCEKSEKSWIATFLLCWFLGGYGIHSFYAGKTINGVIQLLTGGGCGIWWIVDLILILLKKYTDDEGKVICN